MQLRDVESQLRAALEHNEQIEAARKVLHSDLENASAYIQEIENKNFNQHKKSLELLKLLKASESSCEEMHSEIETLRNYIIDLKSRIAVYIPVKNDMIDKRIAEYINNYPDRAKLKIMFMRESEGVYQFGTKRYIVKVDQDKINIRVGGGFLSIDEFLDQYTPTELKLLERKDPMRKFHEKVVVTKAINTFGHIVRDNSPEGHHTRSFTTLASPSKQGSPRKTAFKQ